MTLTHLLRRWPLLLAAIVLGALGGLLAAKLQPPRFVATMTISSVGPEDAALTLGPSISGGSGVLQALRGITGAAGAGSSGDFSYFIALLTSDRTAEQIVASPATLQALFPKEWDAAGRRWHRPDGFVSDLKASYTRFFFDQGYSPPDVPRVKERLHDLFAAQLDIETGSYLLSVKHERCATARSLLDTIFTTTDRVLKGEKRLRFQENIASLQGQLIRLENVPMRSQIADALLAQYLRRIAADSRLPLAARVLDGPGCPPRPTLPLPLPYAAAGAVLALALTIGWLAVAAWRRAARAERAAAALAV